MSMPKFAAIVLIVGSILFLAAAFSPISLAFFTERDAARQQEIALSSQRAWTVSQIFFASGAVVTAIGMGLAVYHWRSLPGSTLASLGSIAIIIGAGFWSWHVFLRTVDPVALTTGSLPAWYFIAYTLLTQAGLVAVGAVLLRTAVPNWAGWVVIGGALLLFLVYLIMKDVPPFLYYILTLLIGIVMIRPS